MTFERTVLGAILLDSRMYKQAAELRPEDFSLESHRRIYWRMVDLAESSRPIDLITLVEELRHNKELQLVGDVGYISSLVDGVPDRPSIGHYVKMVRLLAAGGAQRNSWRKRIAWRTIPACQRPPWQKLVTI